MPHSSLILVVDDTPALLKAALRLLGREGYRVTGVGSGHEALDVVQKSRPSVVLLAVALPDMDGFEVLRAIRSLKDLPQPSIIMMSAAQTLSEDQAEVLAQSADGYLARPISNAELLARVGLLVRNHELVAQLRRSEAQMARAQRIAHVGSWELDVVRDELTWSDEVYRIFGRDRETFEPSFNAFMACVVEEDRKDVLTAQERALAGREALNITHRITRPDGTVRWVHELGELESGDDEQALLLTGVVMDITERHENERHMRLQQAALESAANSIAITDHEGRLLWVNPAFATSYGYEEEELTGKRPGDIVKSGVHDTAFYKEMWETILSGRVWFGEIVNKRRDGSLLTEELTITPIRDAEGKVANFIAIKQDITERKRMEMQFLRSQRMESIGTLAGGIAHDLNNLLAPIVMGVDLLAERVNDDALQVVIRNMGQSASRGTSLVRQVLSFARGVEGARVTLFLDQVLREVVTMAKTSFPKNVRIQTESDDDLWPVIGDPTQLNQVILNLSVNARDAMPDGGTVRLLTRNVTIDDQYASMRRDVEPGDYVLLEVMDTGCGMPPQVRERIFEPFFTTKVIGEGTGLGLSTVIGIVRSHGGFVNVYSEPGEGTSFKVYLPAQQAAGEEPQHETDADRPRGNGETVLVVDDELSILTITRHTLETYGYRVLTAEDGAQAIGVFAMNRLNVDVIITDMMMPVMDGASLIKAIRRIDPNARIIAASGLQGGVTVAKAARVGVNNFLEKPFSASQLLSTIRAALD